MDCVNTVTEKLNRKPASRISNRAGRVYDAYIRSINVFWVDLNTIRGIQGIFKYSCTSDSKRSAENGDRFAVSNSADYPWNIWAAKKQNLRTYKW